jgi:hypothetical protein
MLVFHKDQEVRETTEQILTKVTEIIFTWLDPSRLTSFLEEEVEKLQETLEKIVKWAHEMMPNEAQKAWHKLGAFFNYFWNLAKGSNGAQLSYLRRVNTLGRLIDLIARFKDHHQAGYVYGAPPLDNAIRTIALLARSQPLLIWLHEIPNNY